MPHARPLLSQRIARLILRLIGWRSEIAVPLPAKSVIIGAHHTSGADFFIALIFRFAEDLRFRWIAKDTAFRWPFGRLMRGLGGIPVVRTARSNFVSQVVAVFNASEHLHVGIAPEGTRSMAGYWKTGFYYIALSAGVPMLLGYADYRRKVVGIGAQVMPSGDIEADMQVLAAFYAGVTPRYPERQGEVRLRPAEGYVAALGAQAAQEEPTPVP